MQELLWIHHARGFRSHGQSGYEARPGWRPCRGCISTFHQQVLFPIVQEKHRIVEHVGTVWLEEDIDPPPQLPRAIVHFDSINAATDAYMTFHVGEGGTAFISRNHQSPVKTTDVTLNRLEQLTLDGWL